MSEFYRNTREPAIDGMPAFVKKPGGTTQQAGGRLTASDGSINANDSKELAHKINAIYDLVQRGQIGAGNDFEDPNELKRKQQAKVERHHELVASFSAPDDRIKICGEVYADDIQEVMNRQGFAGTALAHKDVIDGQDNRIPIRRKDVVAFQTINDGAAIAQIAEPTFIYPEDYTLHSLVLMEEKDLAQAGPEFLDQKFQDSLEATLVRQDRILRNLMLATAGSFNAPLSFTTFSPSVLSALRTQIMSAGLTPANMIFSFDLWDDMIAASEFTAWWDPVHKYQLVMEGRVGRLLSMNLITDGFRYDTLRVLDPGEIFVTASPASVGILGVRRELQSTEVNHYPLGVPRRGFYSMGVESQFVQANSIAQASRI